MPFSGLKFENLENEILVWVRNWELKTLILGFTSLIFFFHLMSIPIPESTNSVYPIIIFFMRLIFWIEFKIDEKMTIAYFFLDFFRF